jgi:hypothetical protein
MAEDVPNWLKTEAKKAGMSPSELCMKRILDWKERLNKIEPNIDSLSMDDKEFQEMIAQDLDSNIQHEDFQEMIEQELDYFGMDNSNLQKMIEHELEQRENMSKEEWENMEYD